MNQIFIGIDVSKGYADFAILNQSGTWLPFDDRLDDSRGGHDRLLAHIRELISRLGETTIIIGIEATGGLERNWMNSLRLLTNVVVKRINPLVLKRFLDQDIHRSVTDRRSAQGIARYLAQIRPPKEKHPESVEDTSHQAWYRCIQALILQGSQLKNQLHSLLQSAFPELVQFCRSGFPIWVLSLLTKFPTARSLAQALPNSLKKIPYLTGPRALALIEDAKQSVASMGSSAMGHAVGLLADQLLRLKELIRKEKKALAEEFEDDPGVLVMQTIPGIGAWGAIVLRIEIGQIERFSSAKALVAYSGMDPRVCQSGDGISHRGISRRGNRRIRALMYLLAQVAIRKNPVMGKYYHRLLSKGKKPKVAIIACARKLLHVIYACWITNKSYDETYEERMSSKASPETKIVNENPEQTNPTVADLAAPISRREAKKRKIANLPQNGAQGPTSGGQAATFILENTTCRKKKKERSEKNQSEERKAPQKV
ncbi:MAG: IS110 family transposase [Terrimicrobiaceae bacterium]